MSQEEKTLAYLMKEIDPMTTFKDIIKLIKSLRKAKR